MKILTLLEPSGQIDHIMYTYTFLASLYTGMQNGDESLPSVSPAGRGQLVKLCMKLLRSVDYHYQMRQPMRFKDNVFNILWRGG